MEIMLIFPLWLFILLVVVYIVIMVCIYLLGKCSGYKKCKQDYKLEVEENESNSNYN